jgi:hypothetical protein
MLNVAWRVHGVHSRTPNAVGSSYLTHLASVSRLGLGPLIIFHVYLPVHGVPLPFCVFSFGSILLLHTVSAVSFGSALFFSFCSRPVLIRFQTDHAQFSYFFKLITPSSLAPQFDYKWILRLFESNNGIQLKSNNSKHD